MRFYIKSIKNLGGHSYHSSSMFNVIIQTLDGREFTFVYTDAGNNAECETQCYGLQNYTMLNDNPIMLETFHFWIDELIYTYSANDENEYKRQLFEYNNVSDEINPIDLKWYAYCPVLMSQNEARDAAKDALQVGTVAVVFRGINASPSVRLFDFDSSKANRYGSDLNLVCIDSDGTETIINSGDFN